MAHRTNPRHQYYGDRRDTYGRVDNRVWVPSSHHTGPQPQYMGTRPPYVHRMPQPMYHQPRAYGMAMHRFGNEPPPFMFLPQQQRYMGPVRPAFEPQRSYKHQRPPSHRGRMSHPGSQRFPSDVQRTPQPKKARPNAADVRAFPEFIALAPLSAANRTNLAILEQRHRIGDDPLAFLHSIFDSSQNPLALALQLAEHCIDFVKQRGKNKRLSSFIFHAIAVWAKNRNCHVENFEETLQSRAFLTLVLAKNSVYTQIVVEVYKLHEISPQIVSNIQALKQAHICRLPVQTLTILQRNLQDTVSLDPYLLVGCILQDGEEFVKIYLKERKDEQTKLIKYMDSMIDDHASKSVFGRAFGWNRLHKWPKVVKKFSQLYSISADLTPNLLKQQNEASLNFLIMQRFNIPGKKKNNKKDTGKIQSDQSWNDCIQMMLEKWPELIELLLKHLAGRKNFEEASKWMQMTGYEIHDGSPPVLAQFFKTNPDWMDQFLKNYEEPVYPLVMPGCAKLPQELFDGISMVDSQETLDEFLEFLKLETEKDEQILLGLDSEWRPGFGFVCVGEQIEKTALVQVSFQNRIFLMDVVAFSSFVTEEQWAKLFDELFYSKSNILRIGFDFGGSDLVSLRARMKIDQKLCAKVDVLCLSKIFAQLTRAHPSLIPVKKQNLGQSGQNHGNETAPKEEPMKVSFSLSEIYEACFNVPLDKSEQMTDWERRPLRDSQKHYAAMDAYCQLQIFKHLQEKAQSAGVDFDKIVRTVRGVKEKQANVNSENT